MEIKLAFKKECVTLLAVCAVIIIPSILFFSSCGGGGGGGITPSIPYSGTNTPALITSEKVVDLTVGSYLGMNYSGEGGDMISLFTGSPLGFNYESHSISDLTKEILENTTSTSIESEGIGPVIRLNNVTNHIEGLCGGYASVEGAVNEYEGDFDLVVTYYDYTDDCVSHYTGRIGMKGNLDPYYLNLNQMTIVYEALAYSSRDLAITLSGTWAIDYRKSPYRTDINMVIRDDSTGKTSWMNNYVIQTTTGQNAQGDYSSMDICGKYYNPDYGYVDVVSGIPIRVYHDQSYPFTGILDFTGANGSKARLEFPSQVYFRCLGDTDGNGEYEFTSGLLPWPWESNYTVFALNLAEGDTDGFNPGSAGVAFDGTNYLVITSKDQNGYPPSKTIGILISPVGKVIKTFDVTQTRSYRYSIAFDGTNYLVVYAISESDSQGDIIGQRISKTGMVLDGPNGFLIEENNTNWHPHVVFDGTNYLVVWNKYTGFEYDIYGARVTPSGEILNVFPISEASGQQISCSVAFDGENYFAVWQDQRNGLDRDDIYGARITVDGTVLDPLGIPVSTATGLQYAPALAFDGNNYFAVWDNVEDVDRIRFPPYRDDIHGTRISKEGIVLDEDGILLKTFELNGMSNPKIDFDGEHYLLIWGLGTFLEEIHAGIYFERLTTEGLLVDSTSDEPGIPVSGPPPDHSSYINIDLTSGGDNSLIIWTNNIALGGAQKDIRGTVIPDLDQFP